MSPVINSTNLEISELKSSRRHADDVSCFSQSLARLLLSFSSNNLWILCHEDKDENKFIGLNLGSSFPGSFSLSSHGSLELLRKADILYLDSLHVDTPGISGNLQTMMHGISNVLSIRQDLRQILGTQDVSKSWCKRISFFIRFVTGEWSEPRVELICYSRRCYKWRSEDWKPWSDDKKNIHQEDVDITW